MIKGPRTRQCSIALDVGYQMYGLMENGFLGGELGSQRLARWKPVAIRIQAWISG